MFPVMRTAPKPPILRTDAGRRRKYPFEELAVGDAFLVPGRTTNNMSAHVSAVGKALGRKFSTQMVYMRQEGESWALSEQDDPKAVLGIGVWRDE